MVVVVVVTSGNEQRAGVQFAVWGEMISPRGSVRDVGPVAKRVTGTRDREDRRIRRTETCERAGCVVLEFETSGRRLAGCSRCRKGRRSTGDIGLNAFRDDETPGRSALSHKGVCQLYGTTTTEASKIFADVMLQYCWPGQSVRPFRASK